MTPTNDVAPYVTGADPRRTSMRSTSRRLSVVSAGLKAPPQGMLSTTSKKASNSRNPQNSGAAPAGPASPPDPTSTPAASESASRTFVAPIARNVSPSITSTDTGTSSGASGRRVATTSTCSLTTGTGDCGAVLGGACAAAVTVNWYATAHTTSAANTRLL